MATSVKAFWERTDYLCREAEQLQKRIQADMDMHAGNDAIKWREEVAKSYADWELLPAAKQQNSAEWK